MIKKFVLFLKINSTTRKVVIISSLCLIALIFVGAIYGNFGSLLAKSTPLPINLHSAKQANYSQDPAFMQIPPMQLQLVIDVLWDQNPDAQNLSMRLTQVNQNFFAGVASITPQPPTITSSPMTDTPLPDNLTQTFTPSAEVSPTSTSSGPTSTSFSPTDTTIPGGPTNTSSPLISTSTPPPPTPTQTNTHPPPTHTFTQPPPINTTTSPCGSISLSNFITETKRAKWSINNNAATTITVTKINLTWPAENDALDKIFLGSAKIWDQAAPPPSISITSGWTGGSRTIGSSATKELTFTFISQSISSGYNVTVWFDNGCSLSRSN
jgi:hypothetical protein